MVMISSLYMYITLLFQKKHTLFKKLNFSEKEKNQFLTWQKTKTSYKLIKYWQREYILYMIKCQIL